MSLNVTGGHRFGWQFKYGTLNLPLPPTEPTNPEDLLPATTLNIAGLLVQIAGQWVVMT